MLKDGGAVIGSLGLFGGALDYDVAIAIVGVQALTERHERYEARTRSGTRSGFEPELCVARSLAQPKLPSDATEPTCLWC